MRVRNRTGRERRQERFPPIETEVVEGIRPERYRWKLSKYLLPGPDAGTDARRRAITQARHHEALMDGKFPAGPGLYR